MYLFSMTKKMNQFLRYCIIGDRIFSRLGIGLVEEPAGSRLCGFALAFDRHAKSLTFNLNAYYSSCTPGISVSLLFKFVANLFEP